jgi:hypothetical protein
MRSSFQQQCLDEILTTNNENTFLKARVDNIELQQHASLTYLVASLQDFDEQYDDDEKTMRAILRLRAKTGHELWELIALYLYSDAVLKGTRKVPLFEYESSEDKTQDALLSLLNATREKKTLRAKRHFY